MLFNLQFLLQSIYFKGHLFNYLALHLYFLVLIKFIIITNR